jgi:hypothetical protein
MFPDGRDIGQKENTIVDISEKYDCFLRKMFSNSIGYQVVSRMFAVF